MLKSNLNIFIDGKTLEPNSYLNSTITLDEVSIDKVDAWGVIVEFYSEETGLRTCGVYESVDPAIPFFMVILGDNVTTYKEQQGFQNMLNYLSEHGYTYTNKQNEVVD